MEDKALRFGQFVADSLLESDPKDWSRVKKNNGNFFGNMKKQKITNNRSLSKEVQTYSNTRSYNNRLIQKC